MIDERFIVFAQDVSNQMPLLVGNILEVVPREKGNEVVVHWYSPASVLASGRRSKYGKRSWSPGVDATSYSQSHKDMESLGVAY